MISREQVFTDDDLKRLKMYPGSLINVEALLHRLECAEKVIAESFQPAGMAHIGYDSWHEALRDWEKAAGKLKGVRG